MEDGKFRYNGHPAELIPFRGCIVYCLFHPRELRDTDVQVYNPYCVLKQSGCLVMIMMLPIPRESKAERASACLDARIYMQPFGVQWISNIWIGPRFTVIPAQQCLSFGVPGE